MRNKECRSHECAREMKRLETRHSSFFILHSSFFIRTLLVALVLVVFLQVRGFDFVNLDDKEYIIENAHVRAPLTGESIAWAFTTGYFYNWHPVTWLSHMIDYRIFGANPAGHHLMNVLFHALNTLLVFEVFRRMTGALWRGALVAALFAVHPLHVQSVAWVAERKDVLSTFFWRRRP